MVFTDDWDDIGGGERAWASDDLSVIIRPDIEGWVLRSDNPEFRWFADDLPDMEDVVDFLVRHAEILSSRENLPELTIRKEVDDGFVVVATRRHGGRQFQAELRDGNGEGLGKYIGSINSLLPSFVLGCLTIQGAEGIADRCRGRGLGNVMRDVAEEVMGLPATPHGLNFTGSWLSEAAARSWGRRARSRHVPGLSPDPDVDMRRRRAERSVAALDARSKWPRLADAVAVADATGCDVTTVTYEGRIEAAWVTAANGSTVCNYGILDERKLIEKVARDQLFLPGGATDGLAVDRVHAAEAVRRHGHLREGMVEYMAKDHRQTVDRLVGLIRSGMVPEPPQPRFSLDEDEMQRDPGESDRDFQERQALFR